MIFFYHQFFTESLALIPTVCRKQSKIFQNHLFSELGKVDNFQPQLSNKKRLLFSGGKRLHYDGVAISRRHAVQAR